MDTKLVERAQAGDEAAYTAIVDASYARLQDVAYRILRDPQLAEDATQYALVEAWRNLPGLRDTARFDAWVYRTLVRRCYREASRRRGLVALARAPEQSAADEFDAISDRDQLEYGFRLLSMDHRTVVVLHHYVGMTLEQIADTLGIPLGTVNSRMNRAMTKLRKALEFEEAPRHSATQKATR